MRDSLNKILENFSPMPAPAKFAADGLCVKHDFLSARECGFYLSLVENYRRAHDVPHIRRETSGERSLNYRVIDGLRIKKHLPEIQSLYGEVNRIVNRVAGENLTFLKNEQVGANINITPPGGEYRWHYDRNRITGILYLNAVAGGETECYPNYRLSFGKAKFSRLQKLSDKLLALKMTRRIFGKQILLDPRRGTLVLMRADRCLHSVRRVLGEADRINMIFSYDAPNADFAIDERLGNYLYDETRANFRDPNYE